MAEQRKSNPHAGHRERMRMRFEEDGFDNYRPHEVLEQVLFFVIPRANTNETAHALLEKFGTLENVLDASANELTEVPGIGRKAAEYLASLKENFAQSLLAEYRDKDSFDRFALAFLADLECSPSRPGRLYAVLMDELGNVMSVHSADAVMNDDGGIDCRKTAEEIARIAGSAVCRIVTADESLLDPEQASGLYRTVNGMGCRLEQILLTENGSLYLMVP